jgi:hypothetical protein
VSPLRVGGGRPTDRGIGFLFLVICACVHARPERPEPSRPEPTRRDATVSPNARCCCLAGIDFGNQYARSCGLLLRRGPAAVLTLVANILVVPVTFIMNVNPPDRPQPGRATPCPTPPRGIDRLLGCDGGASGRGGPDRRAQRVRPPFKRAAGEENFGFKSRFT